MPIQVIPYTAEWVPAVLAFNDRMHATGTPWGWFGDPADAWLPARDKKTWREHWLAVEDGALVRGAFALKPHEWQIHGAPQLVVDWQGPVTEGLIDRRWNTLGLRLLREMLKRHPLLYSWGHGGLEQPMLLMLEKLGWLLHRTPFLLRVLRPFRFLRLNGQLRDTRARRAALDAAAFSGAGSIALRALHAARMLGHRRTPQAQAIPFERFEGWADEVWERCAPLYAALACRDADTMNTLLPPGRWPHGIPVRVERDGRTLGWAVLLDTRMHRRRSLRRPARRLRDRLPRGAGGRGGGGGRHSVSCASAASTSWSRTSRTRPGSRASGRTASRRSRIAACSRPPRGCMPPWRRSKRCSAGCISRTWTATVRRVCERRAS